MSRFVPGDRVRVAEAFPPGHVRTPMYVRHKTGVIERYCGDFVNPEDKAYGRRDGAPIALYRVRLRQSDLWPGYTGPPDDVLEIEIYDHWLAPAGAEAA